MRMIHDRTNETTPRQYYESRQQACVDHIAQLKEQKRVASCLRLGVLVFWVILIVVAISGLLSLGMAIAISLLGFVALVIFAARDERIGDRIPIANAELEISRRQLARLDRRWQDLPDSDVEAPPQIENASHDLDLFGPASVHLLLDRSHTPVGRKRLRDWLSDGASPEDVVERQLAARKLAPMRRFRERLDLAARVLGRSTAGPEAFAAWSREPRWLESRRWLLVAARVLVAAWVTIIVLCVAGVVSPTSGVIACLGIVAVNLVLGVLFVGSVHDIFNRVDSGHHDVAHYRELFQVFEELPTDPKLLANLRDSIGAEDARPRRAMSELARIMRVAQMRHSPLFGVFHLLLQLAFLIDFHVLAVLENWHRHWSAEVPGWFDAVAELEAISSLAALHHDHPNWCFPDYSSTHDRVTAGQLGHPLLFDPVRNDVEVGPGGRFLLVTGSNMSGKSTLLRALGTNIFLAQAGAPVCAESFSMPPLHVVTSMRIQDSLEDGVSFFMAELHRLKEIVDEAAGIASAAGTGQRSLLFLLDEILQGTNSAERHTAVARVVRRLTDDGATGAISTHDLALASSSQLEGRSENVHFRETITAQDQMIFDYVMRSGVATSTNALRLLELVGIREDS